MARASAPDDESRVDEILDSVKNTFAQKGFDGASMQDLARGAGMSAGNFYRYFKSKDDIIKAMMKREIECVSAKFSEVMDASDPLEALRALVRWRVESPDRCDAPIWAEIELMAIRRPEVADLVAQMEARLTHHLVAVFGRIADLTDTEAMDRFGAHARLVILLVQGLSMRLASTRGDARPGPDCALAALVARTIEGIIAEILASSQAPHIIAERRVHVIS